MELIADILLVAGALGAGLYCFVLSRRLRRFTDLEQGVGGAVAVLSSQADELKKSLDSARSASDRSGDALKGLTERAEAVAQRLELMMASMHDVIPEEEPDPVKPEKAHEAAEQSESKDEQPGSPQESQETAPDTDEQADDLRGEPAETVASEPPAKAPEGLMFFRHDRKRQEAAE